jgi:group I intron endonuclease
MCGVYRIVNRVSGAVYIGSTTTSFDKRFSAHRTALKKGQHENDHMQKAFNKYGLSAFQFEIIECCSKEEVLHLEQYWLDSYRANGANLYNIALKAGHPTAGRKLSHETRTRMSVGYPELINWKTGEKAPSGNSITQFCLERNLNPTVMAAVIRGEKHSYKGWTVTGREKKNLRSFPALVNRKTGEVIPAGTNLTNHCKRYGLDRRTIAKVLNGDRDQYKGWSVVE